MKVHLVFGISEKRRKLSRTWKWNSRNEGLDSGAHPGVAEWGPGSSSLLSLVWGAGGVGLEEPLIPLRVGGELRPSLGLACMDRGSLRVFFFSPMRLFCF